MIPVILLSGHLLKGAFVVEPGFAGTSEVIGRVRRIQTRLLVKRISLQPPFGQAPHGVVSGDLHVQKRKMQQRFAMRRLVLKGIFEIVGRLIEILVTVRRQGDVLIAGRGFHQSDHVFVFESRPFFDEPQVEVGVGIEGRRRLIPIKSIQNFPARFPGGVEKASCIQSANQCQAGRQVARITGHGMSGVFFRLRTRGDRVDSQEMVGEAASRTGIFFGGFRYGHQHGDHRVGQTSIAVPGLHDCETSAQQYPRDATNHQRALPF